MITAPNSTRGGGPTSHVGVHGDTGRVTPSMDFTAEEKMCACGQKFDSRSGLNIHVTSLKREPVLTDEECGLWRVE